MSAGVLLVTGGLDVGAGGDEVIVAVGVIPGDGLAMAGGGFVES
ncbi:MAG: hypothetical protein ACRDHW_21055 [Ktedonobacteraceae bacterium]